MRPIFISNTDSSDPSMIFCDLRFWDNVKQKLKSDSYAISKSLHDIRMVLVVELYMTNVCMQFNV
jgi:hypothetical protein